MEEIKYEDLNKQTSICSRILENEEPEGHALMNLLVVEKIIEFLTFKDLKKFRQVCRMWNEVSETKFYKMFVIKVTNAQKPPIQSSRELKKTHKLIECFKSTFPPPGMPSNKIIFEGPITQDVLDYIWKRRGSAFLTTVYFRSLNVLCTNGYLNLNNYLGPNITTLDIRFPYYANLKVSLKLLPNIENLHLECCEIHINGKIVPKQLTFCYSNSISYEGRIFCPKILANTFVDFSKIRKLCLMGQFWELDVGSGAPNLESLDIRDVEVIGLRDSHWTTNRLYLDKNVCIGNRIEMKSNLVAQITDNANGIETYTNSVEKLLLVYENYSRNRFHGTQTFWYPNLAYLCITIAVNFPNFLFPIFDLRNCTSLKDFNLSVHTDVYEVDLNRIKLPSCINRLKLCNVKITTDFPWKLDTLILLKYSLSSAKNVLTHFKTTKLALDFDKELVPDEDTNLIIDFWEESNIMQFAIGKIIWLDKNTFLKSPFSKVVDKIGEYFLFTEMMSGTENVVDFTEFRRLCYLNPHEEDLQSNRKRAF